VLSDLGVNIVVAMHYISCVMGISNILDKFITNPQQIKLMELEP